MAVIDHTQLLHFSERVLVAGGMPADDAELVARLLVKADARGYPGHGVTRIPSYLTWLENGTIKLANKPAIVREGKITAVIEGNHYIGQVAAHMAMDVAIRKAREFGAGIVCLRRASHIGRLADFMEMTADAGLIGIGAVSVGSGTTTAYGGMKPVTGTNPMAFGIPARDGGHILLDFATSAMSMGEIQKRVARKQAIPDGVMLDGLGNPTTDFKSFRGPPRGVFLPFGGYKGSGLALVAEILGGLLSGNGLGRDWWQRGGHGINGVFLQAIAVEEFQDREKFFDQMERLAAHVKSVQPAPGHDAVFLPGEKARQTEARQLRDGVEIDPATWAQLRQLADRLEVACPVQPDH